MRGENFCAFILTHGRADRVYTLKTLEKCGYTGRVILVVDNEDKTVEEYRKRYGDMVYVFDKLAVAKRIDEGDNFNDRRAIIYARNACFDIAKELGIEYFIELDDDYVEFRHKRDDQEVYCDKRILDLDSVWLAMLQFLKDTPLLSVAMAQGGDFLGGAKGSAPRYWRKPRRKAMNSFICSVSRYFEFFGRINEDVNTYTNLGFRGGLFMTIGDVALQQKQTQSNAGGMTDLYLASGTYVKSFYTVMYQPSSVRIEMMASKHGRLHHKIDWNKTVPCIVHEQYRKG